MLRRYKILRIDKHMNILQRCDLKVRVNYLSAVFLVRNLLDEGEQQQVECNLLFIPSSNFDLFGFTFK